MRPKRVRVTKGKSASQMPATAVYVGRPSPWGNPFLVQKTRIQADGQPRYVVTFGGKRMIRPLRQLARANHIACVFYRWYLLDRPELLDRARAALRGKDLGCWCAPDLPCHADVLLDLVNQEKDEA